MSSIDIQQRYRNLSPEKRALLAQKLAEKAKTKAEQYAISIRPDVETRPLSFAQQRLWFLYQLEPESPYYNVPAAIELSGKLDLAALTWALNQVVARHEVLRSYFVTEQGYPKQLVHTELTFSLDVVDLSGLPTAERRVRAMELAGEEAARPFDLTTGPLIRASLLRLAADDHILLLSIHHIAFDELSTAIFVQEVAAAYTAYQKGADLPLPTLPIQYADFAHWQRQQLQGPELEKQLAYWKDQLADPPPLLELPLDKLRPPVQSYAGATVTVELPPELLPGLKALSKQENVTLFMTLLAAYQVLLSRYTGQQDISVGTPIANRNRRELESLIGFFVNTLVLRSDLSHNPTMREFLRQVRECALGAYAHQDLPFEMLVDELQPQRHLDYTPFFQTVFAFQGELLRSLHLGDLRLQLLESESATAKFDLMLVVEEQTDRLKAVFEYNTDLFEADTIRQMARHWQNLLSIIIADPDQRVSELPLLDDAERRRLLIDWNNTTSDYPRDKTVAELFEQQVERDPQAVAVIFGEQALTYGELNRRANQLAHYLQSLGGGPDSLVGLFVERNLEMVVAVLAILKAGSASLPLDPAFPAERLSFMLADAQAPVLISQKNLADELPDYEGPILFVDGDWEQIATQPETNPCSITTADNLAYVIYTSGSTGIPKGVAIPQRAITRLVFNTNYIELTSDDIIAQASTIAFDASTFELWGALLHGGKLVIMTKDMVLSPREFAAQLQDHHVTAMFLTTSLFNHIAREIPDAFCRMRTLLVGGEAADPQWMRYVLADQPPQRLLNAYGPTETTTFATWYEVVEIEEDARAVPIGGPLGNTSVFVLDQRMQLVPVGVAGELYIGGDGLARGYLDRPKLTAERFVPHPFATVPGERIYKTGDRVRWLPDGAIEFLGRFDFQVKIRGFRIEPGEVEIVLDQHPQVDQVVVLAREDTPGDRRLVGYIVPAIDSGLTVADLRAYLKSKLPDYMIPAAFVLMDSFPLNSSGKVDRANLPMPDVSRDTSATPFVAPRDKLEQFVADKFAEVLGLEKVGIHDNFFELGGDSLQAAVLINRWQEELHQTAHVRAIFQAPAVAELAAYMVEYYPDAVSVISGKQDKADATISLDGEILSVSQQLDDQKINRFRHLIPTLPPREPGTNPTEKNPPAIFILSPPRSGSTLLRVMLEGHPGLFSPPELDLLSFNTLAERHEAFAGGYEFWLEGVLRAITEAAGVVAAEAEEMMHSFEQQGMSTKAFYRQLQTWIGDRLLVDKTPVYALDSNILERAEQDFENARYIHLVRHPYSSIYSFIEARLDELFFRYEHPFARRELAELIWMVSHENILGFLSHVPPSRQFRLSFEDLVQRPEQTMLDLSRFLQLDYVDDMLRPYDKDRMTTGLREGQQMVGDFKFYLRRHIDPGVVDRWRRFHTEDFLCEHAQGIAAGLGYDLAGDFSQEKMAWTHIGTIDRVGDPPLSFAQQRLWFLDQFDPGQATYNVPLAVDLAGELDRDVLDRALSEIVRRHEVIHTSIASEDGRPRVVIHAPAPVSAALVDLLQMPEEQRHQAASALVDEEARRPFDLAHDCMMRARLLRLDDDKHVLLITFHHIAFDGWSSTIFVRELVELYEAYRRGLPSPLAELAVQYVDFAHWQRGWLQSGILAKQLNYWRQQLHGAPAMLDLPTDRPRPAVQTTRGARFTFRADEALTTAINELSRKEGATLFMTLLAAFQALLSRYSGQADVCVGTPIANRTRQEIEPLIGFFSNTLTIRSDLSQDPTFHQLLGRVRRVAVEAYANQDIPFEMLVDELRPQRDTSTTPLFQVMFSIQESFRKQVELPDLIVTPIEPESGSAKFDINFSIINRRSLRGVLEYNTDLFDLATIKRMAGHFLELLRGVVANPNLRLSELPLLTADEREQQVAAWNQVGAQRALPETIPYWFQRQVEAQPDALAVVYGDDAFSFAELDRRSNQLAHHLQALGVGPDHMVGLLVERSLQMMVGVLGILKAGAAYLPLDPTYPSERIAYMLKDSGASVLVTQEALGIDYSVVGGQGAEVGAQRSDDGTRNPQATSQNPLSTILLDSAWSAITAQPDSNPAVPLDADNMAYVIYTSGSTGRPKGVMISHRSALNLAAGLNERIYRHFPDRKLRISLNAPLPFDASVQQWVMGLVHGHTLDIIPDEVRRDGDALLSYVRSHRLDLVDCVPTQLKLLLAVGLLSGDGWRPLAMLPGGEAIDEDTWRQLQGSDIEFFNMYGPTECTVDSTICRVVDGPQRPSIGRPIGNNRVFVLDATMRLQPVGVPGELYLGGIGVGRGYLQRPSLTAEKFLPDPFDNEPGGRLYRTGDLVRSLPDGNLEFLGRIDHQVKVRGFRIELGEIEAVLRQHEAVADAVVIVREDTPEVKRIVAYLVYAAVEPTVSDLRSYLEQQLPDYMIPSTFVSLPAFPLTPNNKVDRKALPAPDMERPDLATEHVSPRTAEETALAGIWSEVLGITDIGVHDNFFELGGDSIMSIQVISRAQRLGLAITPRQMFQYPTIAGLVQVAEHGVVVKAEQGLVEGEAPLTPIQSWFFEQNFAQPQHWNQSILLTAGAPLQAELLQQAFASLLRHHDALRMRYEPEPDGWVQINAGEPITASVEVIDLSAIASVERASAIEDHCTRLQASLDLSAGPLLRVAYFDLGLESPGRLFITIHHLVIDGVSWRILMEDLRTLYAQLAVGRQPQLPPKSTSYHQWALALADYATQPEAQAEVAFWLDSLPPTVPALPVDEVGFATNSEAAISHVSVSLTAAETAVLLRSAPVFFDAHINDILLTALARTVATWTGQPNVYLHMEGHGREALFDHIDISRTVGWFTTLYPLFLALPESDDVIQSVQAISDQLRALPLRGIGYGLLRYLGADRQIREQLSALPAPQLSFNYLGQFDQGVDVASGFSLAGESKGLERSPEALRPHLLDVTASVVAGQLRMEWLYNRSIHRPATIEQLAEDYLAALRLLLGVVLDEGTTSLIAEVADVELSADDFDAILDEIGSA